MNQVGSNNHTASKPYTYEEVSKYYNLKAVNQSLQKMFRVGWGENGGMKTWFRSKAKDIGFL